MVIITFNITSYACTKLTLSVTDLNILMLVDFSIIIKPIFVSK